MKEGKQAVKMTRLSCHRFRSNEVRLWLSVMAYNLGNLWRRLVLPRTLGRVVADQNAAAAGENRSPFDEACQGLLALPGTRALDEAPGRQHGAAGPGFAAAHGTGSCGREANQAKGGAGTERCMTSRLKIGTSVFPGTRRTQSWPLPRPSESLGRAPIKERLQRRPLGVQLKAARM